MLKNGYVLPKGTRILGNHWAIHRDPDVFVDPETFSIDRWLTTTTTNDGKEKTRPSLRTDLKHVQFG